MTPNIFISSDALPCDQLLFFGELDAHDCLFTFEKDKFDMADMAVNAGFFASKNQARKNGWVGPLPLGFGNGILFGPILLKR